MTRWTDRRGGPDADCVRRNGRCAIEGPKSFVARVLEAEQSGVQQVQELGDGAS